MTESADAIPVRLGRVHRLSEPESTDVAALVRAAERADGVGPIDDQVRAELEFGAGEASYHLLAWIPASPRDRHAAVGYAHVTRDDEGLSGHLVVHPAERRRGVGTALLRRLLGDLGRSGDGGTLRLWAHGNTPAAEGFAAARGLDRVRDLLRMTRSLAEPLPAPRYPPGVTVRSFRVGADESEWLRLNALAFADHPEQGRLTLADLRHRERSDWFDPAGFFIAERDGAMVGSHWTKVHRAGEAGPDAVGEVYAVGVHPDAQGIGLGKALTLSGLHHLRVAGLGEVMLYVDGDNTAAVALYRRLGFAVAATDVMYAAR